MKQFKYIFLAIIAALIGFASCASDEDEIKTIVEGKMEATVDDKPIDFAVTAVHYTGTEESKKYEYIAISGVDGDFDSNNYNTFVITVYGEKLSKTTYVVPVTENSEEYDYFKGYAMGTYFMVKDSSTYISYNAKNSKGTVTIDELGSNNVKGKFDMVLTDTKNESKTLHVKGNFNSKIILFVNTNDNASGK